MPALAHRSCEKFGIRRIPLLAEEGWTRHRENVPVPIWRGRGGQFGDILRPEHFAKLTTPSAALRWLRDFLLMPQPPLLCEEGNSSQPHAYCLTWFPKYLLFS